jgi:hypothetical protein
MIDARFVPVEPRRNDANEARMLERSSGPVPAPTGGVDPLDPSTNDARRARARRLLRRLFKLVVGVSVGLVLAYMVGMNVFLQTRWFRGAISFAPEQLRIEYAHAYSIFPGNIHVRGLSIRGSDTAVEWILILDHCDFHVQFLDLLHQKFHADHVRGSGVSMRIRLRLRQEEATPDVVAALPPVPGFSDPPYLEIGPPTLPLTDANYNLWTIQLDDVDAEHVREVWVQTLRYAGDMRVRGRWLFRPVRWLDIGPATIDVSALDVSYGLNTPLLTGMHGTVAATVHPFDVRIPDGRELLRYVSTRASLSGFVETKDLLSTLAPISSVKFTRGEGPLELELVIEHGVLGSGSRASTSSMVSEALAGSLTASASLAAELRVEGEGDKPIGRVDVGVSNLRLIEHDVELAGLASASIRLESRDLDLVRASFEEGSFAVQLNGARAPSVAFARPLLPAGVAADSGPVRADGHVEGRLDGESIQGQLGITIRDVSLARGTNRVHADVQGAVKLEPSSLRDGDIDLTDSRVALESVFATAGGVHVRANALSLRAERAVIRRGASPVLDVDVDLPRLDVADLRDFNPLLPARVQVAGGRAWLAGHASVRLRTQAVAGTVSLATEGLVMHMGATPVGGSVSCRFADARWNWSRHTIALGRADVTLRDVGAPIGASARPLLAAALLSAHADHLVLGPNGNEGTVSIDLPAGQVDLAALGAELKLPAVVSIAQGQASASLHAEVDVESLSGRGGARVATEGLRVHLGHDTYEGELSVAIEADNRGVSKRATDLSGSSVAFMTPRAADAWWARAWLDKAELRLDDAPRFAGTVHVTAENAAPLQAVLARVTPVPRWVLDAFPTEDLHVDGEIRGTRTSLEARSVVARSSGTSVRLEYAKRDGDREGMALVRSGNLLLGFTLAGAGPKFLLFGAGSWFDRRVASLRARRSESP